MRLARSSVLKNNACMVSYVVKDIENATGPLIQFMVTPLKKPFIPCSAYRVRIVEANVGGEFIATVLVVLAVILGVTVVDLVAAVFTAVLADEMGDRGRGVILVVFVVAVVVVVVVVAVVDRSSASRKLPKAVSSPTTPSVCILRLVTSNGYVSVWATNPAKAPHTIRSMVVKSRPVKCII